VKVLTAKVYANVVTTVNSIIPYVYFKTIQDFKAH
jgi:hypothetical protein